MKTYVTYTILFPNQQDDRLVSLKFTTSFSLNACPIIGSEFIRPAITTGDQLRWDIIEDPETWHGPGKVHSVGSGIPEHEWKKDPGQWSIKPEALSPLVSVTVRTSPGCKFKTYDDAVRNMIKLHQVLLSGKEGFWGVDMSTAS